MSKKLKQKKGFTIIEVVLVLAIAGLIFLMVFVVVPQAMAGQRDAERRTAISRVNDALIQYQTNNKSKRNNLPAPGNWEGQPDFNCGDNSVCLFVKNYLNAGSDDATKNIFDDPDGVPYNMVITDNMSETSGVISGSMTIEEDGKSYTATLTGDAENGYTVDGTDPFKAHTIFIVPGGKCEGEYVTRSELRHFAILYRLEGSGVYCLDSD